MFPTLNGTTAQRKYHLSVPLCKASGYCSLETQKSYFIGSIRSNNELKAALSALAFKNEMILTAESRTDPAAQFLSNFQKAGYGHVLLVSQTETLCNHMATVFTKLGCGWCKDPSLYNVELSKMFKSTKSMYTKYFIGARIIRLGYNVMIIDSGEVHTYYNFTVDIIQCMCNIFDMFNVTLLTALCQ